jgi:hypothetical protein
MTPPVLVRIRRKRSGGGPDGCCIPKVPKAVISGSEYQSLVMFYDNGQRLPPVDIRKEIEAKFQGNIQDYCSFWGANCIPVEAVFAENKEYFRVTDCAQANMKTLDSKMREKCFRKN